MQGLAELPENLAISVIQASPASLDYQLESLPQDLHHLALHAAYPGMLSEGSLSIDCVTISLCTATAALRLFPSVSAPKALQVRSFHAKAVPGPKVDDFFLALDDAVRSGPSKVHIENFSMTAYSLERLLGSLVANTRLSSLKLSTMYVHHLWNQPIPRVGPQAGRRPVNVPSVIAANISELANLKQLVLRNNAESDGLAAERVLVHSMQLPTLLTLLNFDHFGPVDAEVLSSMLPPLGTLKELSLCFWADSDPIADRLASSLATMTKLTSLTLVEKDSISAWDPDRAHRLLPSLSLLPGIQKLDVSGCILDRTGVAHLLTAIPRFDHLTSLALKVTAVGTVTIAMLESLIAKQQCKQLSLEAVWLNLPDAVRGELLCERLRSIKSLHSLRLKTCRVSEMAGRGVNEVFSALTDLTYLSLKQVFNTEPATGIGLRALDRLRKLEHLELDDSVDRGKFGEIDDSDDAINSAFRASSLRTIRLHMYQVPVQLAIFVSRLTSLTQLSASSCLFARDAFSVFCASLEGLSQLQELSLTGLSQRTFHGHIPSEPLAAALQRLSCLKSLTLNRCGFASHTGGLRTVIQDLADMRNLTYLSLKRMPLEASLSDVLVRTLSSLQKLEVLIIASCDVGDTCISAVAEGVSTLPRLRKVDLTENSMTDQGAESLATALYAVPSLRQVFIEQSRIRSDGARALLASVGDRDPARCLEMVATCRCASLYCTSQCLQACPTTETFR